MPDLKAQNLMDACTDTNQDFIVDRGQDLGICLGQSVGKFKVPLCPWIVNSENINNF